MLDALLLFSPFLVITRLLHAHEIVLTGTISLARFNIVPIIALTLIAVPNSISFDGLKLIAVDFLADESFVEGLAGFGTDRSQ